MFRSIAAIFPSRSPPPRPRSSTMGSEQQGRISGASTGAKLALTELARMKRERHKIAVVTAYDAPSARLADAAGVDCVLVGDSAAMTVLGHESTVAVTVDEMLLLTAAG